MKKKVILLGLFIVAAQWIQAQKQLTLEECRQLAIQNNKELLCTVGVNEKGISKRNI